MSRSIVYAALTATLLASAAALAQAPAGAPAGATGICKDGSYATTATRKGACRGHKGVQDWYAAAGATTAAAPAPADTGSKKKRGGGKSAAAEAAPAPAGASAAAGTPPAGASGQCKDGTYSTGASKKGACRGHQGVKEWYASTDTAGAAAPAAAVASRKPSTAAAASVGAAPAGATGLCNDGSYYSGATKKGACRGHKGVKDWYGAIAPAAAPGAAAPMAVAPAAAAPSVAAPSVAARAAAASATKPSYTPAATAAAGGGTGLVWANKGTKVYHCQGDRWYGKTREGAYMSEADAKAQGFRADRGKACQD
jgi:hypothetical protein